MLYKLYYRAVRSYKDDLIFRGASLEELKKEAREHMKENGTYKGGYSYEVIQVTRRPLPLE